LRIKNKKDLENGGRVFSQSQYSKTWKMVERSLVNVLKELLLSIKTDINMFVFQLLLRKK